MGPAPPAAGGRAAQCSPPARPRRALLLCAAPGTTRNSPVFGVYAWRPFVAPCRRTPTTGAMPVPTGRTLSARRHPLPCSNSSIPWRCSRSRCPSPPGPNNVMVTASGANFGYRRTIPHLLGIGLGFPAMVCAVGFGLGGVFDAVPEVHTSSSSTRAPRTSSGWPGKSRPPAGSAGRSNQPGRPFTFLQAAAFQWVNPKGWVVAVGADQRVHEPPGRPLSRSRSDHVDLRLRELSLRLALDSLRGRNRPAPEAREVAPGLQYGDGTAAGRIHRAPLRPLNRVSARS